MAFKKIREGRSQKEKIFLEFWHFFRRKWTSFLQRFDLDRLQKAGFYSQINRKLTC